MLFTDSKYYTDDLSYINGCVKSQYCMIKPGNVTANLGKMSTMSTAYATPNSKYYQDEELLEVLVMCLNHANQYFYSEEIIEDLKANKDTRSYFFDFEIAAPMYLVTALILSEDAINEKDPLIIGKMTDAIYSAIPDPSYKLTGNPPAIDVGGSNMVDKSLIYSLNSLLAEDMQKLEFGINTFMSYYSYKTKPYSAGFYPDGSYIDPSNCRCFKYFYDCK